ncbi:hypothetical protein MY3296_008779 [Beauveria thailandica]
MVQHKITPEDALSLSALAFDWADSFDTKDWGRLKSILAPELDIDYSNLGGPKDGSMNADEFVEYVKGENMLGSDLIASQHILGGYKFTWISETVVQGAHQVRAAHQRYTDSSRAEVKTKGHGQAVIYLKYKKVDDEWKLYGLKPIIYWSEHDLERLWAN